MIWIGVSLLPNRLAYPEHMLSPTPCLDCCILDQTLVFPASRCCISTGD